MKERTNALQGVAVKLSRKELPFNGLEVVGEALSGSDLSIPRELF